MAQINNGYYYATGGRKTATARVFLKPGDGALTINGRSIEDYFCGKSIWRQTALAPLLAVHQYGAFDIKATIAGGGMTGQAGALAHGIAQALDLYAQKNSTKEQLERLKETTKRSQDDSDSSDEDSAAFGMDNWHTLLRQAGLLTRDARKVERKKPGLRKARRRVQFSKR